MLKILVPNIDDEQITSFFEYRDNPEQPKFFNTIDDFVFGQRCWRSSKGVPEFHRVGDDLALGVPFH
jgi:hypothetical protein